MDIKDLKKKIKAHGYKMTSQRKTILEVLVNNSGRFISAEKICEEAKKILPGINITTVYRNLELMENIDVLHKVRIKEGLSLYDVISIHTHHHHIICKSCARTEVIDLCPLENFVDMAEKKKFTLTDHIIELYGYCDKCRRKEEEECLSER